MDVSFNDKNYVFLDQLELVSKLDFRNGLSKYLVSRVGFFSKLFVDKLFDKLSRRLNIYRVTLLLTKWMIVLILGY